MDPPPPPPWSSASSVARSCQSPAQVVPTGTVEGTEVRKLGKQGQQQRKYSHKHFPRIRHNRGKLQAAAVGATHRKVALVWLAPLPPFHLGIQRASKEKNVQDKAEMALKSLILG